MDEKFTTFILSKPKNMKKLLAWLIISVIPGVVAAQHCLPNGISFFYQSEIDDFQVNYPGCHAIDGDVRIRGNDICDLSGLDVVDSVFGYLEIKSNPCLGSLSGLENLDYIQGYIEISNNESLQTLFGLYGLTHVSGDIRIGNNDELGNLFGLHNLDRVFGSLRIEGNDQLTNLTGLDNIHNINGDLFIENNDHLGNLFGLQSLDTISGRLRIESNGQLTDLTGLDNITYINSHLYIFDNENLVSLQHLQSLSKVQLLFLYGNNSLVSLTGLENLESVMGIDISFNNSLTSLDGLGGLDSICYYGLRLAYNPSLSSLSGLENLEYLRGEINIEANHQLTSLSALGGLSDYRGRIDILNNNTLPSLDGIDNFNADSIIGIYISGNDYLCNCHQPSICSFLSDPPGYISVYGNAPGCNGPHEIADNCGFSLSCLPFGNYFFINQEDIDSFAVHYSNCANLAGFSKVSGEDITNLQGLSGVESVSGILDICGNPNLASLQGLERMETIQGNFLLGYWECGGNDLLVNLEGLDSLVSVGGAFTIYQNNGLTDLEGLHSLEWVGSEFGMYDNASLADLRGVSQLSSVGSLRVAGNSILPDLSGLENLVNVDHGVEIIYNPSLESLSGIDNINPYLFDLLWLRANGSLSACDVYSICEFLAHGGGTSDIYGNLPGCNSKEEILEACLVGLDESGMPEIVFFAPNPAKGSTRMVLIVSTPGRIVLHLYNPFGHQVKAMEKEIPTTGSHELMMDISDLHAAVYFYSLDFNEKRVGSGKLVVIR